jgi:hypothetical protein
VLTANHVGENPIDLGGVVYQPVPGSGVRMQSADLMAFKLVERPPVPDLSITNSPPTQNQLITVIGNGRNRGAPTTWMGVDGWTWSPGTAIRWGTNRISNANSLVLGTESFEIVFDEFTGQPNGQSEADIVTGDSGGGAFTGSGTSAELVGILFARATYAEQPSITSLYGNVGIVVDLYDYRDDILAVIDQPDCSDGLDDDLDGIIDFPLDPGCDSPSDDSEADPVLACDNSIDDDNDGLIDLNDPGCDSPFDGSERGAGFECDNGIDDDGDALFDFPDDEGCLHPTNPVEAPEPSGTLMLVVGSLALTWLPRRPSSPRRSEPLP